MHLLEGENHISYPRHFIYAEIFYHMLTYLSFKEINANYTTSSSDQAISLLKSAWQHAWLITENITPLSLCIHLHGNIVTVRAGAKKIKSTAWNSNFLL